MAVSLLSSDNTNGAGTEARVTIQELEPDAYTAMFGLKKYLSSCGLDDKIRDLVKIRAPQINGCAFCVEMHASEARGRGESGEHL